MAVLDIELGTPQRTNNQSKGLDIDLSNILAGNKVKTSDLFGKDSDIETTKDLNAEASVSQMATALGTEIVIGEAGRLGGATVAGPLGYVVGGLASGAAGSYIAQRMINPDNISYGRILADSFINLIPGSKGKKGLEAVTDAVARQGGIGAGIAAGGVTIEKGFDEGRMPTIEELTDAGFTGALLGGGLGLTGAMFSRAYSKIEGLETRDVIKLINTDSDVKTLSERIDGLRKQGIEKI